MSAKCDLGYLEEYILSVCVYVHTNVILDRGVDPFLGWGGKSKKNWAAKLKIVYV